MSLSINRFIDHTLLKPDATTKQIETLCEEALVHNFFGVCVNSVHVPLAFKILKGTPVVVVSVIGFPLGAMSTEAKCFEADWAVKNGASEIDMVISIGHLKNKDYAFVKQDIQNVVKACVNSNHSEAKLKVIIETALLNAEEKRTACQLSVEAGAHFVKTCTGFSGGAASVEDVLLMKSVVGSAAEVKASGGIKDEKSAIALIKAGATRLGTSSGVQIVKGQETMGGY